MQVASLDHTHDLIAVNKLVDFSYEYVNPATIKTLGYSEELLSKNVFELIHLDDLPRVLNTLKEQLPSGSGHEEFRYRKKDGTYIWLEVSGTLLTRENEEPAMVIFSQDISERKQMEEEVLRSNLRYQMVVEDQTDLIGRCTLIQRLPL